MQRCSQMGHITTRLQSRSREELVPLCTAFSKTTHIAVLEATLQEGCGNAGERAEEGCNHDSEAEKNELYNVRLKELHPSC